MEKEDLIPAIEFCANHHIEITFIQSLERSGLIELTTIQEARFLHSDQLQQLEKIVRLYYDMDINLEGIEAINHLLDQIGNMQHEIISLKNKLRMYELNEG